MVSFRRLTRRGGRDLLLLAEATLALALASLIARLAPFPVVAAVASRRAGGRPPDPDRRQKLISRVRWAVMASSRRTPWRAVCLQQGLAAQWMLKRRGIPAALYYGAALEKEAGLQAHVWVKDGETDVIGTEAAPGFAVLSRYPPASVG